MDLPRTSPRFEVIHGGGLRAPAWRDIPSTVLARSVTSRELAAFYRVAQADVQKALEANRRQPLLDLWSSVLGEIPPFPNAQEKWGTTMKVSPLVAMADAHACFRGLKRPMGNDDRGYDCYAFVSKPTRRFVYEPSMACCIKLVDVPADLVHITYVRCDFPLGRPPRIEDAETAGNLGIVTHWHFVEADQSEPNLPVDHKNRYRQRIW
ncbi:MAG TPA: hypothetical protein VE079_21440 [Ensifer sp.]|nr:hypothetical protein [Ensifer sp.]